MGNTVIFASTEATVEEPRVSRPAEGMFKMVINISAGGPEPWLKSVDRAQPKEAVLTMRLLEKIINRINVVDLESLCLLTGRFVWCITTKLVLLNYDGNLVEAASIATMASLMHFKRPEASISPDGRVTVYSLEEKNPVPLTLFHYPICVTFQFMDHTLLQKIISENQEIFVEQHRNRVRKSLNLMICDPTDEEEDYLKNVLIICANTYKEIVAIQSLGRLSLKSLSSELLDLCSKIAFDRVNSVTDYLKAQLVKHHEVQGTEKNANQLHRFDFHDAWQSGELCKTKDYKRNGLFRKLNSNNVISPVDDETVVKKEMGEPDDHDQMVDQPQIREDKKDNTKFGSALSAWGISE